MKILLASLGTRGDMEPFLAVGELLKKKGHEIFCLFPEQFRKLAEESGFEFYSLGSEFMAMLESKDGKIAMGGSGSLLKKIISYSKLARNYKAVSRQILERQYATVQLLKPDRIVHHAKTMYPLLWSIHHPGKTIMLSPVPYVVHEVKERSHVMFNRDLGPVANKATYKLARFGLVSTLVKASRQLKLEPRISAKQLRDTLDNNSALYTVSPCLFPRPNYWPSHHKVVGYHERDKTSTWEPEAALQDFIKRFPKFILITFGSMSNPDPIAKTNMLLGVLEQYQIPAIVNTAGGGLVDTVERDLDLVYFVSRIPYDYIFPKTYAVIHHGGSGTTHTALKYGCASMIIPHIIDQFLWNKLLAEKGVGPKGPSITALSKQSFGHKLLDLWQNPAYKRNAKAISSLMAEEAFESTLIETIEKGR